MPNREKDTPRVSANTKRDIDIDLGPKRGTQAKKEAETTARDETKRPGTSNLGRGGV